MQDRPKTRPKTGLVRRAAWVNREIRKGEIDRLAVLAVVTEMQMLLTEPEGRKKRKWRIGTTPEEAAIFAAEKAEEKAKLRAENRRIEAQERAQARAATRKPKRQQSAPVGLPEAAMGIPRVPEVTRSNSLPKNAVLRPPGFIPKCVRFVGSQREQDARYERLKARAAKWFAEGEATPAAKGKASDTPQQDPFTSPLERPEGALSIADLSPEVASSLAAQREAFLAEIAATEEED